MLGRQCCALIRKRVREPGTSFDLDKAKRTAVTIVWYSHRPDWHELVFSDGDYERVPGTLEDAAALAEASRDGVAGIARWQRAMGTEG